MQPRANGEALHASTIEQIYSRMHDVNGQFVQHPECRPYVYEGLAIHEPNELSAKLGLNEDLVRAQIPPLRELMWDVFPPAFLEFKTHRLPPTLVGSPTSRKSTNAARRCAITIIRTSSGISTTTRPACSTPRIRNCCR